ncbi:LLM class flavin-dependent oxidoreductase [Adhaeribacter soli]|uniref:Luciferase-like monooxygenase n=1 Tax=Adhaeribacter soli TaxID=2607655 RepID=A0A5N1IJM5_9BACT|nr:LLM class flavin-dependent oxidoreductase [Adhaeribacter soli]KAA9325608.1 LLM class flavin-dependent oxidoreductase [Adhaeribacter soli]
MTPNKDQIPYSLLELAIISNGKTVAETFETSLDLARKAEELGYSRFWLAEHHNAISIASSATAVLIGYIAGGTKLIRVGSGGIMLPNHSPLIVAEQFGTLGTLYPNRIDLGLGRAPGTDQVTAQAIRSDRMQSVYKFPEEIQQIQQYFSPDNASAKVRVPMAEGVEVPIYVLGSSTDSAHLAAKLGLPYAFASHFATTHLFEALQIYYNEFQPSEFLQEPYSIACINVIAADTDAEAERLSTSLLWMFVSVLTGRSEYLREPTEMSADIKELWNNPSVQQMLKYTFVGNKATVKQKTREFLTKTGVNELMVVSNLYAHEDRVKSYRIFAEIMQEISAEKQAEK